MLGKWIRSSIQSGIDIHNSLMALLQSSSKKICFCSFLHNYRLIYRWSKMISLQNDFTLCCNAVGNYLNSCALSLLKVKKDCTCTNVEEPVFAPRKLPKGSIGHCKIQPMSIRMAASLLQWFV